MLLYTTTIQDYKVDVERRKDESDSAYNKRKHSANKHRYKALEKITNPLVELGFVTNLSDDYNSSRRDQLFFEFEKEFFKTSNSKAKASSQEKKSAKDKYYMKSPITMQLLLNGPYKKSDDFLWRLEEFLSFQEVNLPLGEVGTLLKRRMGAKSFFGAVRFKNNRPTAPVNDVHLLDFLNSIEKGYYCIISYKNNLDGKESSALILPLEIRISKEKGREYIVYYDVVYQTLNARRLDFIEKVMMQSAEELLDKNIVLSDYAITFSKTLKQKTEKNKVIAEQMLSYVWGTEFQRIKVNANYMSHLCKAVLELEGKDPYEFELFETKEFRSFVRKNCGFVKRVVYPEQQKPIDNNHNGLSQIEYLNDFADFEDMYDIYQSKNEKLYKSKDPGVKANVHEQENPGRSEAWVIDVTAHEYEGHSSLFNQYYSIYTEIMADAILSAAKAGEAQKALEHIRNQLIASDHELTEEEIDSLQKAMWTQIQKTSLLGDGKNQSVQYKRTEQVSYLMHLLPLGKIEVRWLLAALDNQFATMFLTEEEIAQMKRMLYENAPYMVEPFRFDCIKYFDEKKSRISQENINEIGNQLILAILLGCQVDVNCSNGIRGPVSPYRIDYSEYANTFTLMANDKKGALLAIPFHKILEVKLLKEKESDINEDERKDRLYQITLEFGNEFRTPDRILNEMSAFKKICSYKSKEERYELTIFYANEDRGEIIQRLLGYGRKIRIIKENKKETDKELILAFHARLQMQYDLKMAYLAKN